MIVIHVATLHRHFGINRSQVPSQESVSWSTTNFVLHLLIGHTVYAHVLTNYKLNYPISQSPQQYE